MDRPFVIPRHGVLVAFCGLDGSGKSSQLRLLAQRLQATHTVHCTRQPTGAFRADPAIRSYIDGGPERAEASEVLPEIALLAATDRFRHLRTEVMPHLNDGDIVLCDRYLFTSYAYSTARGLRDLEWIRTLNRFVPMPDLTLYLDVPPAVALQRVLARGDTPRPEERNLELMGAVRDVFRRQPWGPVPGYHVVDGTRPRAVIAEQISSLMDGVLARKRIRARATAG